MKKHIIAASLAALLAGSLAACSTPAESAPPAASTPAASQAAVVTTAPQPSASAAVAAPEAAAPAVADPAPTRSPGPGSVKAEPGEDVFDFNIRKNFWANVEEDGSTAGLYESDAWRKWRQQVGYHAPNGNMTTKCTLGTRIAETPERDAAARRNLHRDALEVPGVRVFAYPLTCPPESPKDRQRVMVVIAAVNPQLKIEELNYDSGRGAVVFGLPDTSRY